MSPEVMGETFIVVHDGHRIRPIGGVRWFSRPSHPSGPDGPSRPDTPTPSPPRPAAMRHFAFGRQHGDQRPDQKFYRHGKQRL